MATPTPTPTPAPSSRPPPATTDHVKVLGILSIVLGALIVMLGLLLLVGLAVFLTVAIAPDQAPRTLAIPGIVIVLVALIPLAVGVVSIVAGIGLLRHRSWARLLTFFAAIPALLSFPLGTAYGVYAIWVLTRPETHEILQPPASASDPAAGSGDQTERGA